MSILPYKRILAAKDLHVWITNHYTPTLFGVRGHYETSYKSGLYVETFGPGTGFFARSTSSKAYKAFTRAEKQKLAPSYLKLLKGQEFNFDKELALAKKALETAKDENKIMILESYVNVLPIAMDTEKCERTVEGIKRVGHQRHKLNSYQTHVLSHYKSRIANNAHHVRSIQLSEKNLCSNERFQQFADVVKAFSKMAACHRIWHEAKDPKSGLVLTNELVYFDMGMFDFIQSPLMTPMMRDSQGTCYFLYPDFMVAAKSNTDFECYSYDPNNFSFLYREIPYESLADKLLSSYANIEEDTSSHSHRRSYDDNDSGSLVNKNTAAVNEMDKEVRNRERVLGELYIPQLKLRFFLRDASAVKHFTNAMTDFICSK